MTVNINCQDINPYNLYHCSSSNLYINQMIALLLSSILLYIFLLERYLLIRIKIFRNKIIARILSYVVPFICFTILVDRSFIWKYPLVISSIIGFYLIEKFCIKHLESFKHRIIARLLMYGIPFLFLTSI